MARRGISVNTILRAIASLGTDAAEILREEVELLPDRAAEIGLRWLDEIGRRLSRSAARAHAPVAPFWVTRYLAKRLAHELVASGLIGRDAQVPEFGCCHVTGVGEGDEGRRGAFVGLSRFEKRMQEKRAGGRELAVGRMKITRPPLALRQPSVLRGGHLASRCRTQGTQITRPDRKVLDGAIFGRGPSGGGGTVLVDASGSMSLSAEEVEAIVKAAGGAAVVAMYSGRADVGELRIVASGDRRVTNDRLEPYGSGNVIDLPALEWLLGQPPAALLDQRRMRDGGRRRGLSLHPRSLSRSGEARSHHAGRGREGGARGAGVGKGEGRALRAALPLGAGRLRRTRFKPTSLSTDAVCIPPAVRRRFDGNASRSRWDPRRVSRWQKIDRSGGTGIV